MPWLPVRSTSSLVFGRITSPDLDALLLSETGDERPRAEGLDLHGEHSAVSTKSALNPSACWPEATLDVGLDCLSLS